MLSEFKQTGEAPLAHDETVLEVDVKAAVEKKRPVPMAGLAVRVDRSVGGLLKRCYVRPSTIGWS